MRINHDGVLHENEPQLVSVIIIDAEAILPDFRNVSFVESDSANQIFTVSWLGEECGVYQIETSPDMLSWQAMPGEIVATNALTTYDIDMSDVGDRQFVRVRKLL